MRRGEAGSGFLLLVLQLVNTSEVDMTVRQTGGVYFKNAVKRLWAGEEVSLEAFPRNLQGARIAQLAIPTCKKLQAGLDFDSAQGGLHRG